MTVCSDKCSLCRAEHITGWEYEDEICWVARCSTHLDKFLCVLKRHTSTPTEKEREHMVEVMERLFPHIQLRGPASIPEHYHLHEV